ncbi:unnamed protein product [Toxocara canis]|uniref:Ovule protein n=1 Tax=Toxocara canis TaxID=6265 RepID=A0A183VBK7_TOXCA|nr:unnamed protein product [Toxocara canis]
MERSISEEMDGRGTVKEEFKKPILFLESLSHAFIYSFIVLSHAPHMVPLPSAFCTSSPFPSSFCKRGFDVLDHAELGTSDYVTPVW